jgi:hypothetical protein
MPEPGRCASCRWWEEDIDPDRDVNDPRSGVCQLLGPQGRCVYERLAYVYRNDRNAGDIDNMGDVGLQTQDTFGCVQWQAHGGGA